MVEVVKSATFERWFTGLRDRQARARISTRILLLCGGTKASQGADIERAKVIAAQWKG